MRNFEELEEKRMDDGSDDGLFDRQESGEQDAVNQTD